MSSVVAKLSLLCVIVIVISLMLTFQSSAKIDSKTIVGMWLFDEGIEQVAKDSSGNGNDGKLINGPKWVVGKFGKALSFGGPNSNNCVLVPDSKSLSMAKNMTIMAWINASDLAGSRTLIRKGPEGNTTITWIWYIRMGTQLCFFTPAGEQCATFNPTTGNWYHLVTVIDDSNNATHYINGVTKKPDLFFGGKIPTWADNDEPLNIGEWSSYDFGGTIDEVAIFNVALTENDIKSVMTEGLSHIAAVSPSGKLTTTLGRIKSGE